MKFVADTAVTAGARPLPRAPAVLVGEAAITWTRGRVAFWLGLILATGAVVRLVNINAIGFNSDEAVYAGQAASLGGNPATTPYFPVFRAHPMLVQTLLSGIFAHGVHDTAGRLMIVFVGLATVALVYLIGREFYGPREGLVAAGLMAVLPYHVLVTRLLLLDGPMTFFTTLCLFCLVRCVHSGKVGWYAAAGTSLGLSMLCKESAIVITGAIYAFLALTPRVRRPVLGTAAALVMTFAMFAIHPVSVAISGHKSTAKSYLVWQLVRGSNHEMWFYFWVVPVAIGPLVLIAAYLGVRWRQREGDESWREVLLVCWALVPFVAFTLWPVKGFQYLLPAAPALLILAGRGLVGVADRTHGPRWRRWLVAGIVVLSVLAPTAVAVSRPSMVSGLAGTSGTPGGREAGTWIDQHTPAGSVFLTVGPSMANLVEYYGHRRAYGLSVSPNPLHRNPSYEPIPNPDLALRSGQMQYVVWDVWSAGRSSHFAGQAQALARRYHGRVVHTEYSNDRPVVIIYAVRP